MGRRIRQQTVKSGTDLTGDRWHEQRARAVDLTRYLGVEQHDGHTMRDGLEGGNAEAFIVRQEREHPGRSVQSGHGRVVYVAVPGESVGDPERPRKAVRVNSW